MHDFVMGKRKQKVLLKSIEHAEGEIAMMMFAVYRVECHILQRVMHPAHVPLHSKTQASRIGRAGHGWPGGGFWKELLNSDAPVYGGSGLGNLGGVVAEAVSAHGRSHRLALTLPPLAVLFLKPAISPPRL